MFCTVHSNIFITDGPNMKAYIQIVKVLLAIGLAISHTVENHSQRSLGESLKDYRAVQHY